MEKKNFSFLFTCLLLLAFFGSVELQAQICFEITLQDCFDGDGEMYFEQDCHFLHIQGDQNSCAGNGNAACFLPAGNPNGVMVAASGEMILGYVSPYPLLVTGSGWTDTLPSSPIPVSAYVPVTEVVITPLNPNETQPWDLWGYQCVLSPVAADTAYVEIIECGVGQDSTWQQLLVDQNGCDSLLIITELFYEAWETSMQSIQVCDESDTGTEVLVDSVNCQIDYISYFYTSPFYVFHDDMSCGANGVGVFTEIVTGSAGCDSIIITTTVVLDTIAPNMQILFDQHVCEPMPPTVEATDNCGDVTVVITESQYSITCDSLGIEYVVTATDVAGNVSIDTLNQYIYEPGNFSVYGISDQVTGQVFAGDTLQISLCPGEVFSPAEHFIYVGCSGDTLEYGVDGSSLDFCENEIRWLHMSVVGDCGEFGILVYLESVPIESSVIWPSDINLECDSSIDTAFTGVPMVTGCPGYEYQFVDVIVEQDVCGTIIHRLWEFEDGCGGNEAEFTQLITIEGWTEIFPEPWEGSVVIECGGEIEPPYSVNPCNPQDTVWGVLPTGVDLSESGLYEVAWLLAHECDTIMVHQEITVTEQGPVIDFDGSPVTISCNDNISDFAPEIIDAGCCPILSVDQSGPSLDGCGQYEICWDVACVDGSYFQTFCLDVTVIDTIAPVILLADTTFLVDTFPVIPVFDVDDIQEDCALQEHSMYWYVYPGECVDTVIYTFMAEDVCGNVAVPVSWTYIVQNQDSSEWPFTNGPWLHVFPTLSALDSFVQVVLPDTLAGYPYTLDTLTNTQCERVVFVHHVVSTCDGLDTLEIALEWVEGPMSIDWGLIQDGEVWEYGCPQAYADWVVGFPAMVENLYSFTVEVQVLFSTSDDDCEAGTGWRLIAFSCGVPVDTITVESWFTAAPLEVVYLPTMDSVLSEEEFSGYWPEDLILHDPCLGELTFPWELIEERPATLAQTGKYVFEVVVNTTCYERAWLLVVETRSDPVIDPPQTRCDILLTTVENVGFLMEFGVINEEGELSYQVYSSQGIALTDVVSLGMIDPSVSLTKQLVEIEGLPTGHHFVRLYFEGAWVGCVPVSF